MSRPEVLRPDLLLRTDQTLPPFPGRSIRDPYIRLVDRMLNYFTESGDPILTEEEHGDFLDEIQQSLLQHHQQNDVEIINLVTNYPKLLAEHIRHEASVSDPNTDQCERILEGFRYNANIQRIRDLMDNIYYRGSENDLFGRYVDNLEQELIRRYNTGNIDNAFLSSIEDNIDYFHQLFSDSIEEEELTSDGMVLEVFYPRFVEAWNHGLEEYQNAAATTIQSGVRRFLTNVREEQTRAAISIQREARSFLERNRDERQRAVIKLQAALRGRNARREVDDLRTQRAAIAMQSLVRRKIAQRRVQEMKEERAALKIQSAWRGYKESSKYKKQKKAIEDIKSALSDDATKRIDRDQLKKEIYEGKNYRYDPKTRKLVEYPLDDRNAEKMLSYTIAGFNKDPLDKSDHPNDDIKLHPSGIPVVQFDKAAGGIDKFNGAIETAMARLQELPLDSKERSYALVEFTGSMQAPMLGKDGQFIFDEQIGPDGSIMTGPDGKPLMTRRKNEVDVPFCIVHSEGPHLFKSFVTKKDLEAEINLSDSQLEARKEQLIKSALEQLSGMADGEEKNKKVLEIVRSALRQEAKERFERYVDKGREESKLTLKNSQDVLDALVEANKKMKGTSKASRKAFAQLSHVPDPMGPKGSISFSQDPRDPFNKKVTFRDSKDNIAYVAIPGTPLHTRVQVALKDGDVINYYKDGKQFSKTCRKGEIVLDDNTTVYLDPVSKTYRPVSMKFHRRHSIAGVTPFVDRDDRDKGNRLKDIFKGAGKAENYLRNYKKMNIQAVSIIGQQVGVGMIRKGKDRNVAAMAAKCAYKFPSGSDFISEKKIPQTVSLNPANFKAGGNKDDDRVNGSSAHLKIPRMDDSVFEDKHPPSEAKEGRIRKKVNEEKERERLKSIAQLREDAERDLRILVKVVEYKDLEFSSTGDSQDGIIASTSITNSNGEVIEIDGVGDVYVDGIVDKDGNIVPKQAIIEKYGKKFYEELINTKSRAITKDEFKEKSADFLESVRRGDLSTVESMVQEYNDRLDQAVLLASDNLRREQGVSDEERLDLQAKVLAAIMENNAVDLFKKTDHLKGGMNALHLAVMEGRGDLIPILLQAGFDPNERCSQKANKKDKHGMNAREIAEKFGYKPETHPWVKDLGGANTKDREEDIRMSRFKKAIKDRGVSIHDIDPAQTEQEFLMAVWQGDVAQVRQYVEQYEDRKSKLEAIENQMAILSGKSMTTSQREELYRAYNFDPSAKIDGVRNALDLVAQYHSFDPNNPNSDGRDGQREKLKELVERAMNQKAQEPRSETRYLGQLRVELGTSATDRGGAFSVDRSGNKIPVTSFLPDSNGNNNIPLFTFSFSAPNGVNANYNLEHKIDTSHEIKAHAKIGQDGELVIHAIEYNTLGGASVTLLLPGQNKALSRDLHEYLSDKLKVRDERVEMKNELKKAVEENNLARTKEILALWKERKTLGVVNFDINPELVMVAASKGNYEVQTRNGEKVLDGVLNELLDCCNEFNVEVNPSFLKKLKDGAKETASNKLYKKEVYLPINEVLDAAGDSFNPPQFDGKPKFIKAYYFTGPGSATIKINDKNKKFDCDAGSLIVDQENIYTVGISGDMTQRTINEENDDLKQECQANGLPVTTINPQLQSTLSNILSVERRRMRGAKAQISGGNESSFKRLGFDNSGKVTNISNCSSGDFSAGLKVPGSSISKATAHALDSRSRSAAGATI